MSISVIINTRNSSQHLRRVLESVKDFDEVIVCDMASTDATLPIAEEFGTRIESVPLTPDGRMEPVRNMSIAYASGNWVFVVDDDEIVPDALRRSLYNYIHGDNPADGLYLPRRNFVMNRFNAASYPDYRMRFFRKGCSYWPPEKHSQAQVTGTIGKIPSNKMELALIHMSPSMHQMMTRIAYDSKLKGYREGLPVSLSDMFLFPLGKFLNSYIMKGNILHGIPGILAAYDSAIREIYKLGCRFEESLEEGFPDNAILPDPTGKEKKNEK